MAEAYRSAKTLQYGADITYTEESQGRLVEKRLRVSVALAKPKRIYVRVKSLDARPGQWLMVCDGRSVVQVDLQNRQVKRTPAPTDAMMIQASADPLRRVFIQAFMSPDPYPLLTRGVTRTAALPQAMVSGERCRVVERTMADGRSNRIWISLADGIPRRSASYSPVSGSSRQVYREERFSVRVNERIPERLFTFRESL